MRKINEQNERLKHEYLGCLRNADGKDEATLDKVAASLLIFEEAVDFNSFKSFHRDWADTLKAHLASRKNRRTGKPLGLATRDAVLRDVREFLRWLASQKGYKSRVTFNDVRYFNNNAKDARIAHSQRPRRYPSLHQCGHAFRQMPETSRLERRDKALFALWVMTGARAGALASLRIQHVDLVEGLIYQDAREVKTKNGKTFETWFFPVDQVYRDKFCVWHNELTGDMLFGPGDALFPKQKVGWKTGAFVAEGFEREPYANAQIAGKVIGSAFQKAGLHQFNPHSIRTTLAMLGDRVCETLEARKAWSQNLGHESLATTVSAYMPVCRERQGALIKGLSINHEDQYP